MNLAKQKTIRSKQLRDSAEGQDCTLNFMHCSYNSEETVLCHVNANGDAMGGKGDDFFAVYGCASCHDILDGRKQYKERISCYHKDVLRAVWKTQKLFIEQGLMSIKQTKAELNTF